MGLHNTGTISRFSRVSLIFKSTAVTLGKTLGRQGCIDGCRRCVLECHGTEPTWRTVQVLVHRGAEPTAVLAHGILRSNQQATAHAERSPRHRRVPASLLHAEPKQAGPAQPRAVVSVGRVVTGQDSGGRVTLLSRGICAVRLCPAAHAAWVPWGCVKSARRVKSREEKAALESGWPEPSPGLSRSRRAWDL